MNTEFEEAAREERRRGPSDTDLRKVSELARRQREQEHEVQDLETKLKNAKQRLRQTEQVDLPEAMQEAGLSEAALDDGSKIVVKEGVNAHISKEKQGRAHQWLIDNGYGDLIKRIKQINIGRDDDLNETVANALAELGVDDDIVDTVQKVEPQTLKAWARERIREGEVPPEDLFGIFQYKQAKVESPKS